eukprot:3378234-Prymnesium_polylepis.1
MRAAGRILGLKYRQVATCCTHARAHAHTSSPSLLPTWEHAGAPRLQRAEWARGSRRRLEARQAGSERQP